MTVDYTDHIRRTKIIATLGPATDSIEKMEELILAGVNVFRINMSHASHEQVESVVNNVRALTKKLDRQTAVLMDTQGPAIRTGDVSTDLNLTPGERFVFTVRGEKSEEHSSVDVNYDDLVNDISIGDTVLVDNGEIQLKVLEKKVNQLHCEVLTPGVLGSRRHINLPGVRVNLPALTEKDMRDVTKGIELGVDIFAMSFVREAEDVMKLKAILEYHKAPQQVIAKLEDQEGIRNLDAIIDAADGIMVARGDLGIECPFEELPIIQRRIVKRCAKVGKPVIVATHMLESMIENPTPTRAEITDVANAVFEQADAIMLSGETSVGAYPVECIKMMDRIARRTEMSGGADYSKDATLNNTYARLVRAASVLAMDCQAKAMIVFTRTGLMARNASWLRPQACPIYAFTPNDILLRQLPFYWGMTPFHLDSDEDPALILERAIQVLKKRGLIASGDKVIAVTELRIRDKVVDSIQMEEVD